MKKVYLLALLLAATTLASCEKWLQIDPQYEITDDDLYKNTAGYYKSLNGLYFQMSGYSLYGKELSWGMTDVWARYYAIDPASDEKSYPQIYNLEYEAKEIASVSSSIWNAAYKIIAQANDLIAHTEKTGNDFFIHGETDRNTILGEAYAVRAMVHLDLMRLYGASMQVDPDGRYIAYVENYPSTVNPPIPSREFMGKAIADLKRARTLLTTYDVEINPEQTTSTATRFFASATPQEGKFYSNRGTRLNYYATTLLLARTCLWAGEREEALVYAQEIIDLVKSKKLEMARSSSIRTSPKILTEVLFALFNEKLVKTYEPYTNTSNSSRLVIDDNNFFFTPSNDRRQDFIEANSDIMQKYVVSEGEKKDMLIPNIRISEAYYIAAECLYKTDMKLASEYLMTVRKARGYTSPALNESTPVQAFEEALVYEYRKEFIGEGQLLFFFKRTNRPITFSGGNFNHAGKLVLPIPDSESAI